MDTDLDALLSASAPPTAARTPALQDSLTAVATSAEPRRRPQRMRRGVAAALVAAGLVGAGVAAQAGGLLPQPSTGAWDTEPETLHLRLTVPSGETCDVDYMVTPTEVGATRHPAAEWKDAWAVALDVMRTVDPASLQSDAIRARYRQANLDAIARLSRTLPPEELAPPHSEQDVFLGSIGAELRRRIDSALVATGHDPVMITMVSGNTCDPDAAS
ncbi:hypothetical protein [Aeromicrobium massiliense]|uniref:hypothetical protein n=1 Tax=Aeromicrobium massiliense TaxID=1464554 RepID=UPI0002F6933D|nr:hypothetical protein [Aeromicrobium massiliense]